MPPNPFHPAFTRIHDHLYISTPPPPAKPSTQPDPLPSPTPPPTTILLLTWGNASPQPIKKYTTRYQTIYPTATIILFLTSFSELILHTSTSQSIPLSPAITAILAADAGAKLPGRTLTHIFSNGGAYKLHELALAYKRTTGNLLPMDMLVIDSAPGLPDFRRSVVAFQTQFSKIPSRSPQYSFSAVESTVRSAIGGLIFFIGTAVVYLYLSFTYILTRTTGRVPITKQVWEGLNDRNIIDDRAKRVYMYSKTDELINWHDILAHANGAEKAGWEVRRVEFEGSRHVAHAVGEVGGRRYWDVIGQTWDRISR